MTLEEFGSTIINLPNEKKIKIGKDPDLFNELFEKVKTIANGPIPGNTWLNIDRAISEALIIPKEAFSTFSDEDILLLIQDRIKLWQEKKPELIQKASIGNPTYILIQMAFSYSAEYNYYKTFTWLMDNFNICEFDNDGLSLILALRNSKIKPNPILILLCMKTEEYCKEHYAIDGILYSRLKGEIKKEYFACQNSLPIELKEELKKFLVIQDILR